jgi:WD40 repeat protein
MQLCVWNHSGNRVHAWSGNYRVRDCSITPDGRRLVVLSSEKKIHVYDFRTREEEYSLAVKVDLTCLSITSDSRYMLVNRVDNEIQLLDIETAEVVRKYSGQKQGQCVIRSIFGGANENFVVSGSEGRVPTNPYSAERLPVAL